MRSLNCLSIGTTIRERQRRLETGKTMNRIRSLRQFAEEGQSLVEFAIASVVFFYLIFAIFDFGHLFFVEMDVQNALQEAGRYGSTGNHLPDPKNPGNYLSRATSIINTFKSEAFGVNISNVEISSLKGGPGNAGGPGDELTVSSTVSMPLMTPLIAQLFPNGQYTFTASTTVMNEPFPPGQTN